MTKKWYQHIPGVRSTTSIAARTYVGTQAGDNTFNPGTFNFHQLGFTLGGPILKNRLFFFGSYDYDANTQPATSFVANTGGQTVGGNITRVLLADLDSIHRLHGREFGYQTGPYPGYNFSVPSQRFPLSASSTTTSTRKNKVSVPLFPLLNSSSDQIESNSNSAGNLGNPEYSTRTRCHSKNSNYKIKENNKSARREPQLLVQGEHGEDELIVGYYKSDESRDSLSSTFPAH